MKRFDWRLAALILGALFVLGGAVMLAGASPAKAVMTLLNGSIMRPGAQAGTLRETTPLIFTGLAVYLALRAGLFNIGVEGQLLLGALACAVVASRVPGPAGMALGGLVAMLVGALWALPAGLIRVYRNGHEVITTIMLNNVAGYLTDYLVNGPFRAPDQQAPATALLPESSRLPALYSRPPFTISSGLLLGVLLSIGLGLWLNRTVKGYELKAVGANATAAKFAGVDPRQVMLRAMLVSGAIAGLGGAVQVLAYQYQFFQGFSPGYGFDGLGIALLSGGAAYGVIPAALLFGILAQGGVSLGIEGIPKGITVLVLGIVILVAAALRYRKVKTVA